jgi:hypothetical protein
MVPINTYGWDFPDIGALIAPRPLLIAQANRDGLNTIESVRDIYFRIKNIYDLYDASEHISLVETPGGHSYHTVSRQKIFAFFLQHLMGKKIPFQEIDDVDESASAQLSAEELKIFVNGPLPDDRTTSIQESFIKAAEPPAITTRDELTAQRQKVVEFLKEKTFAQFADPAPFDPRLEFRTLDQAPFGQTVYSFVSEKDWRLWVDIRWKHPRDQAAPLMLVLRNPHENRWDSESFVSGLPDGWNIAYFKVRGIGETGWSPAQQWHVRRAAAWTGRTVASMRVYDVRRCLEFVRTLPGIDADKTSLAARDEMTVIALYAALLDGHCVSLLLKDPPATQNAASRPDGRGPAIEMLNCLRITDVHQLPGLLCPMPISFIGAPDDSYNWSRKIYQMYGQANAFNIIQEASALREFVD